MPETLIIFAAMIPAEEELSFKNTAIAFGHKSTGELKKAALLFKSFGFPILLKVGPALAKFAVMMGFKWLIKKTIFAQFCGGETIEESAQAIAHLTASGIGTILDYSVEGEETESVFDATCAEIMKTIATATGDSRIPFSVFKTTGIIRFELLEKLSAGLSLTDAEIAEFSRAKARFEKICTAASKSDVRIFIDAEESWIQPEIDRLTEEMMVKFNQQKAIVFNTIQLYRHDRLAYLQEQIKHNASFMGFKLVRGAYMEKETARAIEKGYPNPIQPSKEATDADYDKALELCIAHLNRVSICAGTHNEKSSQFLVQLMQKYGVDPKDDRVYFSQLLGMSDHISFNLAHSGYHVAKYVPYGPVTAVIPYLTRRAIENSSVAGQMGRELGLIQTELKRRKATA